MDVGANIGLTACVLSQFASTVHAFEPHPAVYATLVKNVTENNLAQVKVHNCAIGAEPGTVRFAGGSAYGFVSEDGAHEVAVETVDDFVKANAIERVDFIKIDVEGFEPNVLKGACATIERFNPIIYMEFNSWALLSQGRTNPLSFLSDIFGEFEAVYVAAESGQFEAKPALAVLHDNLAFHGSVNDLILLKRSRPLKLPPAPLTLMVPEVIDPSLEIKALKDQIVALNEQAAALEEEAVCLKTQIATIQNSTSWRVTAPLRRVKRAISWSRLPQATNLGPLQG